MRKSGHWIEDAVKHPGALKAKAKAAGMSTAAYAAAHAHSPGRTGQQSRLAQTLSEFADGGMVDKATRIDRDLDREQRGSMRTLDRADDGERGRMTTLPDRVNRAAREGMQEVSQGVRASSGGSGVSKSSYGAAQRNAAKALGFADGGMVGKDLTPAAHARFKRHCRGKS